MHVGRCGRRDPEQPADVVELCLAGGTGEQAIVSRKFWNTEDRLSEDETTGAGTRRARRFRPRASDQRHLHQRCRAGHQGPTPGKHEPYAPEP